MATRKETVSPHELWAHLGSGYGVLKSLGYDHIPTDHNPVWLALAGLNPVTAEQIDEMVGTGQITPEEANLLTEAAERGAPLADRLEIWNGANANKKAILGAYVLCQTACLNAVNGPIRDGSLGTLRQRWYFSKVAEAMGFKLAAQALETAFIRSADVVLVDDERSYNRARKEGAQDVRYKVAFKARDKKTLQDQLGRSPRIHFWPKAGWGRVYAQQQSALMADLVREGLTYEQLWIRDASRDSTTATPLLPHFNGILILEKQGLFEHFTPIARRLGFPILLAMSGNNAFSGVEALINDSLRNYDGSSKVTDEAPLHIFSITDHDYFGHIPVEQGAVEQFARYYGDKVRLHRIGISPELVEANGHSPIMAGYEIEADYNAATWEWALEHGIWAGEPGDPDARCYGIEVEALEPQEYVQALIDALVLACGGDEAVRKALAKLAEPDWYTVRDRIEHDQYLRSRLHRLLKTLERWTESEDQDRVQRPVNSFVYDRIETATKWECTCGKFETDVNPAELEYCPVCGVHRVYDAQETHIEGVGYLYVCPCGYRYESDPTENLNCPECGESLTWSAEGVGPWKEAEHVQQAMGDILERHAEDIDFKDLGNHATRGYGVWRPASADQATEAATELFVRDYEKSLQSLARLIDRRAEDLIGDLEAAYRCLDEWELTDPDD